MGVTKYPSMHRTSPSTTKNHLVQNVDIANAEKPWAKLTTTKHIKNVRREDRKKQEGYRKSNKKEEKIKKRSESIKEKSK